MSILENSGIELSLAERKDFGVRIRKGIVGPFRGSADAGFIFRNWPNKFPPKPDLPLLIDILKKKDVSEIINILPKDLFLSLPDALSADRYSVTPHELYGQKMGDYYFKLRAETEAEAKAAAEPAADLAPSTEEQPSGKLGRRRAEPLFEKLVEQAGENFVATHRQFLADKADGTIASYSGVFNAFAKFLLTHDVPLAAVTGETLRVYLKEQLANHQPSTVKSYASTLNSYFSLLVKNGLYEINPVADIVIGDLRITYPEQFLLTRAEIENIAADATAKATAPLRADLENAHAVIEQLQADNQRLNTAHEGLQAERDRLSTSLAQANSEKAELQATNERLETESGQIAVRVEELEASVAELLARPEPASSPAPEITQPVSRFAAFDLPHFKRADSNGQTMFSRLMEAELELAAGHNRSFRNHLNRFAQLVAHHSVLALDEKYLRYLALSEDRIEAIGKITRDYNYECGKAAVTGRSIFTGQNNHLAALNSALSLLTEALPARFSMQTVNTVLRVMFGEQNPQEIGNKRRSLNNTQLMDYTLELARWYDSQFGGKYSQTTLVPTDWVVEAPEKMPLGVPFPASIISFDEENSMFAAFDTSLFRRTDAVGDSMYKCLIDAEREFTFGNSLGLAVNIRKFVEFFYHRSLFILLSDIEHINEIGMTDNDRIKAIAAANEYTRAFTVAKNANSFAHVELSTLSRAFRKFVRTASIYTPDKFPPAIPILATNIYSKCNPVHFQIHPKERNNEELLQNCMILAQWFAGRFDKDFDPTKLRPENAETGIPDLTSSDVPAELDETDDAEIVEYVVMGRSPDRVIELKGFVADITETVLDESGPAGEEEAEIASEPEATPAIPREPLPAFLEAAGFTGKEQVVIALIEAGVGKASVDGFLSDFLKGDRVHSRFIKYLAQIANCPVEEVNNNLAAAVIAEPPGGTSTASEETPIAASLTETEATANAPPAPDADALVAAAMARKAEASDVTEATGEQTIQGEPAEGEATADPDKPNAGDTGAVVAPRAPSPIHTVALINIVFFRDELADFIEAFETKYELKRSVMRHQLIDALVENGMERDVALDNLANFIREKRVAVQKSGNIVADDFANDLAALVGQPAEEIFYGHFEAARKKLELTSGATITAPAAAGLRKPAASGATETAEAAEAAAGVEIQFVEAGVATLPPQTPLSLNQLMKNLETDLQVPDQQFGGTAEKWNIIATDLQQIKRQSRNKFVDWSQVEKFSSYLTQDLSPVGARLVDTFLSMLRKAWFANHRSIPESVRITLATQSRLAMGIDEAGQDIEPTGIGKSLEIRILMRDLFFSEAVRQYALFATQPAAAEETPATIGNGLDSDDFSGAAEEAAQPAAVLTPTETDDDTSDNKDNREHFNGAAETVTLPAAAPPHTREELIAEKSKLLRSLMDDFLGNSDPDTNRDVMQRIEDKANRSLDHITSNLGYLAQGLHHQLTTDLTRKALSSFMTANNTLRQIRYECAEAVKNGYFEIVDPIYAESLMKIAVPLTFDGIMKRSIKLSVRNVFETALSICKSNPEAITEKLVNTMLEDAKRFRYPLDDPKYMTKFTSELRQLVSKPSTPTSHPGQESASPPAATC